MVGIHHTALVGAPASDVVYRSEVSVEPKAGGVKMVHLPAESEPVPMGMHGAIAAHCNGAGRGRRCNRMDRRSTAWWARR